MGLESALTRVLQRPASNCESISYHKWAGHGRSPYEQNTQQSSALGVRAAPQPAYFVPFAFRTRLRSTPTPSISTSTTSPSFIAAVAPGVPV